MHFRNRNGRYTCASARRAACCRWRAGLRGNRTPVRGRPPGLVSAPRRSRTAGGGCGSFVRRPSACGCSAGGPGVRRTCTGGVGRRAAAPPAPGEACARLHGCRAASRPDGSVGIPPFAPGHDPAVPRAGVLSPPPAPRAAPRRPLRAIHRLRSRSQGVFPDSCPCAWVARRPPARDTLGGAPVPGAHAGRPSAHEGIARLGRAPASGAGPCRALPRAPGGVVLSCRWKADTKWGISTGPVGAVADGAVL